MGRLKTDEERLGIKTWIKDWKRLQKKHPYLALWVLRIKIWQGR